MNIRTFARAALYALTGLAVLDVAGLAIAALIIWDADFVRYITTTFQPALARMVALQWVAMMVVVWPYAKRAGQ